MSGYYTPGKFRHVIDITGCMPWELKYFTPGPGMEQHIERDRDGVCLVVTDGI